MAETRREKFQGDIFGPLQMIFPGGNLSWLVVIFSHAKRRKMKMSGKDRIGVNIEGHDFVGPTSLLDVGDKKDKIYIYMGARLQPPASSRYNSI